jgi:hypothetical protein
MYSLSIHTNIFSRELTMNGQTNPTSFANPAQCLNASAFCQPERSVELGSSGFLAVGERRSNRETSRRRQPDGGRMTNEGLKDLLPEEQRGAGHLGGEGGL